MQLSYQAEFHCRWDRLNDPHVRDLAWLLDSPDLLDPKSQQWRGQIAALNFSAGSVAANAEWLHALDADPQELRAWLQLGPYTRLGKYAEKLMAFYFRHAGMLRAHGVQVRNEHKGTVGEFDFLLQHDGKFVHWEFATKFYLLQKLDATDKGSADELAGNRADYFVGPNLADSLGAKMRKILDRQLSLSSHPAAQTHLPQPVEHAQALVKGWLFYHESDFQSAEAGGVTKSHCRGFWRALSALDEMPADAHYLVLPRLSWLAPAKKPIAELKSRHALQNFLESYFLKNSMPVLIAVADICGPQALENQRGFIVPNDWCARADEQMRNEKAD